ncbi:hypothetical protein VCRA2110O318_100111 [Vibrio crassostreae]|nr:hypothetical protein VCRA2117O328_110090 [Vibrio crassostreae]CAK2231131.1 hypothetical protein VCRA2110O318_100111 [Vibrio crassostreae]CAK2394602.1 hypothetical protein VCRA2110O319_100109 [Vibrio crassostreae]
MLVGIRTCTQITISYKQKEIGVTQSLFLYFNSLRQMSYLV